jgi:hypothetical protein
MSQAGQDVALRVPFVVLHKWDKVGGHYQHQTEYFPDFLTILLDPPGDFDFLGNPISQLIIFLVK